MPTLKERRKAKALKRSQQTSPKKKKYRNEEDIERLRKFNLRKLLFRKF